ncbi:MAG: RNA pyrophosphohydrolase [Helicobacteraceae bacterium]|jgi:putative (di)nucleoside polyphosphate hydrolase|nr:RNA pyrophosphohydrolase [Helicobacteraceae bacterium]
MEKNYRPNVAAVILSSQYPKTCELLIAERSDIKGAWQFPQGGIDGGEDTKTALFRELSEEIGTNEVEIIAEHPDWISYDFPGAVAERMYPYDGQRQKYFLVRLKNSAAINLETKSPEFTRFKFVPVGEALKKVSYFKRPIYKKVLEHFKKSGYL